MAMDQDVANDQELMYLNEGHDQDQLNVQGTDTSATGLAPKDTEKGRNGSSNQDQRVLDVMSGKPCKICYKVLIPVEQFPKFNFVGKILGPKGNSLKRLQESTGTRMAVLGRGSMRDKAKEDQMRQEGGKYDHLNEPLHVWIEAYAQPAEALRRMSHAVSEVKKYLNPEYNDDIRQQQLEELMSLGEVPSLSMRGRGTGPGVSAPPPPPPPQAARGGPVRGGPVRGMVPRGGMTRGVMPPARGGGMVGRPPYPTGGAVAVQPTTRPPAPSVAYGGERYDYQGAEQDYSTDYNTDYSGDYSTEYGESYAGSTYAGSAYASPNVPPPRPVREATYTGGTGDGADGYGFGNESFPSNVSSFGKAQLPPRGRGDFRTRPY